MIFRRIFAKKITFVVVAMFSLGLMGCEGSGGKRDSSPGPTEEMGAGDKGGAPVPKEKDDVKKLLWGELSCQKSKDCDTDVLNLEYSIVLEFLNEVFVDPDLEIPFHLQGNSFASTFYCGVYASKMWSLLFSEFPEFIDVDTVDFESIDSLMLNTLDLEDCSIISNLEEEVISYFKNTKEYKNENK